MDKVLGWFLVSCGFAVTSLGLALSLWHTRKRAIRAEQTLDQFLSHRVGAPILEGEAREHALDALAMEMERIGEGQRFLTKALLDRGRDSLGEARPSVRSVTPH